MSNQNSWEQQNRQQTWSQQQTWGQAPQQPRPAQHQAWGQQGYTGGPVGYGAPGKGPRGKSWMFFGPALALFALLAIIGSCGTWATMDLGGFGTFKVTGLGQISGPFSSDVDEDAKDGVITLVLGILALLASAACLLRPLWRAGAIVAAVMGALIAAVGFFDLADLPKEADAGWGLVLVAISGTALLIAGIIAAIRGNK